MSWLHYLIEANIYLGVFYLCYCLLLNRDTHYMLGRAYLILSCVMAFVLPVTQLSILKPVVPEIEIAEPAIQINAIPANLQLRAPVPAHHLTFDDALVCLYVTGAIMALFVLLFRLRKLYILTRNNNATYQGKYKLVQLADENTAFSFFNYLFIGSNLKQPDTIIAHELVHIRQKHSLDIIFMEVVKIINWFNPFIYLMQRSLKTVHEYIADEQTAAHERDAVAYSSFLLNNAYGVQCSSVAHSFFNYNLLKKRIIMLNKNRSGKLARLKYLAALPLCAGMLCTSTLTFSKDYGLVDLAPRRTVKPVADSAKYVLQMLDDRNNVKVTFSDMVFHDSITGVDKKYNVNTFTEADQAALKKHGVIIRRVNVNEANADTNMLKLTQPQEPASHKSIYSVDKNGSALVIAPQSPATNKTKLAPPPPYESAYVALYQHMAKTLRYPQSARESKTDGNVILSYRLDAGHKITDVKVEKGIGKGCDEAAVYALRSFKGTVDKAPGQYYMATVFALQGYTKQYQPMDSYRAKPNFAGVVIATGYITAPSPAQPVKITKALKSQPKQIVIEEPIKSDVTIDPPAVAEVKDPGKVIEIAEPVQASSSSQINRRPPPPVPNAPAYTDFLRYVGKHTRYPTVAYNNKVNGHVTLTVVIGNNHKISDARVVSGIGSGCDEEAARAIKTYAETFDKAPGTYKMVVTFLLRNEAGTKFYAPKPLKDVDSSNFIGQVVVAGSIND